MSTCDASEGRRARHERKPSRARRGHAGFTLIEVLAAVALLGILYSVLARVAIEGLRAEGESERRLEASLLADERLSAVIGPPLPPLGHVETTEGDFKIAIDVTPFQMPTQWGNGIFEVPEPLLLAVAPNGSTEALRSVQITISWLEAASARHVSRTTYLLDLAMVADLEAAAGPGTSPTQNSTGTKSSQKSAKKKSPKDGGIPTLEDRQAPSEQEEP